MDGLARMRPLHFLSLSLVLLLPLRMGAQEGCDNQRTPVVEIGPGYFALPLHHAVSLPLRDLPDESASEEAPVRIRPLHRITLPQPPNPPQPDPAIEGANSGGYGSRRSARRCASLPRTVEAAADAPDCELTCRWHGRNSAHDHAAKWSGKY